MGGAFLNNSEPHVFGVICEYTYNICKSLLQMLML